MSADKLKGKQFLKAPGHFIDEATEQVEAIKRKYSIAALFEGYGVKLTKSSHNGSYTGICPWHDDHNPSLSVDETKGLFYCFGCDAKGDVIELVRKMENVSFRDAIRKLQGATVETFKKPEQKRPEKKKEPGTTDGLSKPDADKEQISRIKDQLDKNTVKDEMIEAAAVTEEAGAEASPFITLDNPIGCRHNCAKILE